MEITYLQEQGLLSELTMETKEVIDSQTIPVFKLYRLEDSFDSNSVLFYLLNRKMNSMDSNSQSITGMNQKLLEIFVVLFLTM